MYNFTLIIPTHNRHQYLKRSIEYFKDIDAEVIYCDSSSIRYCGLLSNNIKYLHLPDKSFAEKILLALDQIETKFVSLCADDDFILKDALYQGVSILEGDSSIKTVVGRYIFFNQVFDGHFYNCYSEVPADLTFDSKKNAATFFPNYYQILWALYDKSILVKSYNIVRKASFRNDNFIELVVGSVACYEGGIKFLKRLWGVREVSTQEHWGSKHEPITGKLLKKTKEDYLAFEALVDQITMVGYSKLVINSYIKQQREQMWNILKRLFRGILPKSMLAILKRHINNTPTYIKIEDLSGSEASQLKVIVSCIKNNVDEESIL